MFKKIMIVCFMLIFSACATTKSSFFGMRLKSDIVKVHDSNVECALVEGFINPGEVVCVCCLSLERLRIESAFQARVFIYSTDPTCSNIKTIKK